MNLSKKELKALYILKESSYQNPIRSSQFSEKMWPDSNMHTKVSNTGNGATAGKSAWLVGGSYLSKLSKKGVINKTLLGNTAVSIYYINSKGKELLNNEIEKNGSDQFESVEKN